MIADDQRPADAPPIRGDVHPSPARVDGRKRVDAASTAQGAQAGDQHGWLGVQAQHLAVQKDLGGRGW